MTDLPISSDAQRSRQTASEAERWFWSSRLEALAARWRRDAWKQYETSATVSIRFADELDALIAERIK